MEAWVRAYKEHTRRWNQDRIKTRDLLLGSNVLRFGTAMDQVCCIPLFSFLNGSVHCCFPVRFHHECCMLRKISCLSFLVKRHQPYVGIEITVPGIEIAVRNLIFWTFNLGLRCAGAFGLLSWGRAECIFHPELSVIKYRVFG